MAPAAPAAPARPKNVVLVVGDGFGVQQLGLFDEYAKRAPSSPYPNGETTIRQLMDEGTIGLSQTATPDTLVVDSAASATQLASGAGGRNGAVGMNARGEPVETFLDRARARGKAIGIVSDARVTHATPAAFASHAPSRHDENEIAEQLVRADVDLILGGGWRHFVPKGAEGSKREDERDLLAEAASLGKTVVRTRAELRAAGDGPLLGLFGPTGLMDAMQARATEDASERSEPSLPEMVRAAIARLDRDPDGFVLIVEAAQIDWAGHANDVGWMLNEVMKLDATLADLREVVRERGDTLLIVTGDHETGGFGFTYKTGPTRESMAYDPRLDYGDPRSLDLLAAQRRSADDMIREFMLEGPRDPDRLVEIVATMTDIPLTREEAEEALEVLNGADEASVQSLGKKVRTRVTRTLADKVSAVWSTGGHTSTPVPVLALGPASEHFKGLTSHLEIGRFLMELYGE